MIRPLINKFLSKMPKLEEDWKILSFFKLWLVRVTLVVAFGFLPQNFGRWWGPTNSTLSVYECRFSGGWWRHWNPTKCKKKLFQRFALTGGRDTKTLGASTHTISCTRARALAPKSHKRGTFTTFNYFLSCLERVGVHQGTCQYEKIIF